MLDSAGVSPSDPPHVREMAHYRAYAAAHQMRERSRAAALAAAVAEAEDRSIVDAVLERAPWFGV